MYGNKSSKKYTGRILNDQTDINKSKKVSFNRIKVNNTISISVGFSIKVHFTLFIKLLFITFI